MERETRTVRRRADLLCAALAVVLLAASLSLAAQSPSAFGTPTEDAPNPAATIAAVPGSRAQGWLAQGRSEVLARHGIVATSDPLAVQAGLEILQRGGNAIDAAVAAGAVLDMTSQNDTGIGGDLFALVWVAQDNRLYALNSAGWAPAGWTPEFFRDELGLERMPGSGVNATTVPGAISGYDALLQRFGTLTFRETFARAAQLADEGWGQSERRHRDIVAVQGKLRGDPDSNRTFLNDGRAPTLYSLVGNPDLAAALRLMQERGREAFLRGRDRRCHRRQGAGHRWRDDQGRPGGVRVRMGGAGFHQLSRLRRLRAASPRPGLCRPGDAQHPRGLRAGAWRGLGPARTLEPGLLALHGRSQEAGLFGPVRV